ETAVVDLGRLKRIIYNLGRNAVEVLSRGDRLGIALGAQSDALTLSVTDNGPGLPDELKARLFEPFVKSNKVNGNGLGLSIVKRFVDDHEGQIKVESEPGRGTSFEVRLPSIDP